jgi:hypothetical protein
LDLSKIHPDDYTSLIHRWRGGSENVMLAYARDEFAQGTNIADQLGQAIEPGFYLFKFEGDCYCYPGTHGNCVDSQGEGCGRNPMRFLPQDAEVDLHIVQDLAGFKMVHSPDWLFL